jgi:hypothetical protein
MASSLARIRELFPFAGTARRQPKRLAFAATSKSGTSRFTFLPVLKGCLALLERMDLLGIERRSHGGISLVDVSASDDRLTILCD